MKQLQRHTIRTQEVRALLNELSITLLGNVLSIGCGSAPELEHLMQGATYTGIDCDNRYIQWCRQQHQRHNTQFVHDFAQAYLEESKEQYDIILMLDVDSNTHPDQTALLTLKRLAPQGIIIMTERADNRTIYGQHFLSHLTLPASHLITRPTHYDHLVCIIRT